MGSTPTGISGSRAAAVLGMSPWQTPFQVWQDIMEKMEPGFNTAKGYDYTPFEGNASTRWGLAFEDSIIRLAERNSLMKPGHGYGAIIDREREFKIAGREYITCHIDGKYEHAEALHEGKTTTDRAFAAGWGEPGTEKIPLEYQVQVQHQMLCTGAKEAIVSVLVFPRQPQEFEEMGLLVNYRDDGNIYLDNDDGIDIVKGNTGDWADVLYEMGFFHQYIVPSNPELHEIMLEEYRKWWDEHILKATPPRPSNYDDIRAMFTAPTGTIVVDDDTSRWFHEYKDIGREIGSGGNLAKRQNQLKTLILERAAQLESTLDDESTDKWVFRDERGKKLGSYGKNKNGTMTFR